MENVKLMPDDISKTRHIKVVYVKLICSKCGNTWGSTVDRNTNMINDRDTVCMVCAVDRVKKESQRDIRI